MPRMVAPASLRFFRHPCYPAVRGGEELLIEPEHQPVFERQGFTALPDREGGSVTATYKRPVPPQFAATVRRRRGEPAVPSTPESAPASTPSGAEGAPQGESHEPPVPAVSDAPTVPEVPHADDRGEPRVGS